jgi:pantoate--beta-alanine ligase
MQVFQCLAQLKGFQQQLKSEGKSLGFIATMGALHEGHLTLLRRAQSENEATIVSIFVNPTQFNNPEDLKKYPRRTDEDLTLLEKEGATAVFMPSVKEMYGDEVISTKIDLLGLDIGMEGDFRPGHFDGVATVVKRLFELIKPQRAYFGNKDYQQVLIVQHVARFYKLPIQVIGCETARYESGLAMSSRNYRLSDQGMREAAIIYKEMTWAIAQVSSMSPMKLREAIKIHFAESSLELEYVEFADAETVKKVRNWSDHRHVRVYIAALCEGVRLIDNRELY